MSKELFIAAHEELIEQYMEAHPDAGWSEAYDKTSDAAYGRMQEKLADMADAAHEQTKDRFIR